jgi:putative CocE/NonD family hydrolase
MKKTILIIAFCHLLNVAYAQNKDSLWVVNNYTKIERQIPMRDGIRLFTSIYIPKDASENHPFLMTRTPYSCKPYGEDKFTPFWKHYSMAYLKEGYIMVMQDVRGKWMSEGEFADVRPFIPNKKTTQETDEASDTYDAVDWLVRNIPNNNGKVGIFGISYPGFYSTMAAAANHPAIVAVSPQAPVTNWFIGDDFHHNGAFFLMDAFSFYSPLGRGFGLPHPRPTTTGSKTIGYPVHDNYKFYLETGALSNFAKLMGDSINFWKDIYAHPNYDEWWKSRDARNATKNLTPAMLWVGGLFDAEDNWGAWNSYKTTEINNPGKDFNKIVMGPWYHTQWASKDGAHLGNVYFGSNTATWYQQNIEIPFFNWYLKNKGDISNLAEATIFISGENNWRQFNQWPPAEKEDKSLFLQPNGGLDWKQPTAKTSSTEYISDPAKPVPYAEGVHFDRTINYMTDDQRFAERRPDVIAFKTDVLTNDLTVTGAVKANLFASISTTDADFVVKVIDVFPDNFSYNDTIFHSDKSSIKEYPMGGYEMLVHGEIFRGRFRNSFEKPEPFVPNKIELVSFNVGEIAHTFKKGHRIMMQIQSSWFPLADRNPQKFINIFTASENDFQKAAIRIYHDEKHRSSIILPVFNSLDQGSPAGN